MKKLATIALLTLILFSSCTLKDKAASLFSTSPDLEDYASEEVSGTQNNIREAIDLIQEKEEFQKEIAETQEKAADGETLIQVTYPEAAKTFRTADLRVVIWGDVYNAEDVAFIQVNDYILTRYKKGQKEFNYIATSKAGTLKRGENTYTIKALDDDKNVITESVYTVLSDAKYQRLTHSGPEHVILFAFIAALSFGVLNFKRA